MRSLIKDAILLIESRRYTEITSARDLIHTQLKKKKILTETVIAMKMSHVPFSKVGVLRAPSGAFGAFQNNIARMLSWVIYYIRRRISS